MSDKKDIERFRNRNNNAWGNYFEKGIEAACRKYRDEERANITKVPEPFRVLKKEKTGIFKGRFIAKADPDFQGTLPGGRSIVFEAKYTTTDTIRQSVLTKEQTESLEDHHKLGALAAVCVGIDGDFFFIPWEIWRDMKTHIGKKSAKAKDLEKYKVRFTGAVLFLDPIVKEVE